MLIIDPKSKSETKYLITLIVKKNLAYMASKLVFTSDFKLNTFTHKIKSLLNSNLIVKR